MVYIKGTPRTHCNIAAVLWFFLIAMVCVSCAKKQDTSEDPQVKSKGSIEVTAKLEEIRDKKLPDMPMYDYAYVFKYKVLQVHHGKVEGDVIYIGQYNPLKPRDKAADPRVPNIGGNLKKFRAGDIHRMALEVPIDDYYMGGIINKYFEEYKGPIYWAVWTNLVK